MASSSRWPQAVLAGLATSMRTFAAPAALAARGRITGPARPLTLLAAAGELAVDKSSAAADRFALPGLGARLAAGSLSGRDIAGPAGFAGGAAGAAVGTYATWRARKLAVKATGLPDPVIAVGEDIIAFTAAAIATHPGEPGLEGGSVGRDAVRGLAAGLAGTAAMSLVQGAEFVLTSAKPSRAPADAAERLKRLAGLGRIKRSRKPAVNQGMHWLYGTSWGVPLGLIAGHTDAKPELLGPAFGLFVWGAALVHQPLIGVADVPWKRSPASLGSEALFHLVYGIGAAAALRALDTPSD